MKSSKITPSPKSSSPSEGFSSADVSKITGVSLRQLQWWDEQGVVSPVQSGHKRLYQLSELIEIGLINELRQKGVSLQKIRRVLRFLEEELGQGLYAAIRNGAEIHLLTDGQNLYLEDSHKNIIDILKNSRQPILSVCITDHVRRLTSGDQIKKMMRSERKTATRRSARAS